MLHDDEVRCRCTRSSFNFLLFCTRSANTRVTRDDAGTDLTWRRWKEKFNPSSARGGYSGGSSSSRAGGKFSLTEHRASESSSHRLGHLFTARQLAGASSGLLVRISAPGQAPPPPRPGPSQAPTTHKHRLTHPLFGTMAATTTTKPRVVLLDIGIRSPSGPERRELVG